MIYSMLYLVDLLVGFSFQSWAIILTGSIRENLYCSFMQKLINLASINEISLVQVFFWSLELIRLSSKVIWILNFIFMNKQVLEQKSTLLFAEQTEWSDM